MTGTGQGQEGRAAHAVLNVKGDDLIVVSANVGARQSPPVSGLSWASARMTRSQATRGRGTYHQTSWFSATARAMVVEVDGPHRYGRPRKADDADRDRHGDRCGVQTSQVPDLAHRARQEGADRQLPYGNKPPFTLTSLDRLWPS
jgi:hypothetical protein